MAAAIAEQCAGQAAAGTAMPPRPQQAAELGRWLRGAGYTEPDICSTLGVAGISGLRREGPAALAARLAGDDVLRLALRLFLAGMPVEVRLARRVLGSSSVAGLTACGLLQEAGGQLHATASVTPVGELLVSHDRIERHGARATDFVLGPGPATRHLWSLTVRRPVRRLLDLGCGSAALGCLAAAHAGCVVASDINLRALRFARFNAALNELPGVHTVRSDLLQAFDGPGFDQIICNPPYVVSPASTFTYRDAAADICSRVVRAAAAHLAPGGIAQIVCQWPQRRGGDRDGYLAAWFEDCGCHAWVLCGPAADPVSYAAGWLAQSHTDPAAHARELEAWLDFYRREQIEAIGQGLVVLRATAGRAPWTEIRDAPPLQGDAGCGIAAVLDARALLASLASDDAILDAVLQPARGLQMYTSSRPGTDGWADSRRVLRTTTGYRFAVEVDPLAALLVGHLDGQRSVRQAAQACAASLAMEPQRLLAQLPGLVRDLAWLGLLGPAAARQR